MKILILYFSGVGATKKISEMIKLHIEKSYDVEMYSFENADTIDIEQYDVLVIGTPVYHAAPARMVTNYFNKIRKLKRKMPTYIYNTRTLYSCNTNRKLAKQLKEKNIFIIMDREYKSPASDGTLMFPFIKSFFNFSENIEEKVKLDCEKFISLLKIEEKQEYIPYFRFSSILNALNMLFGQLITVKIYLHNVKCIKCGKCIRECPYNALYKNDLLYPEFIKKNCENCYRCIHHCPVKALSISKKSTPKKLITYDNIED